MTLIELMIAMLIGLIILGGAISMFITNKRIYRDVTELGELQENGRFVLDLMVRDIRMAGYAGCSNSVASVTDHISTNSSDLASFTDANAIVGTEGSTDSVTIRYLDPIYDQSTVTALTADMTSGSSDPVSVNQIDDLATGQQVAISDCNGADIFKLTGVDSTNKTLTHTVALSRAYSTGADIDRFVTHKYYISNDSDGVPSLYWTNENGNTVLVHGVDSMQLLYSTGTSSSYVDANSVADWTKVVNVKLALLLRSQKQNFNHQADTKTYDLLGTSVGPFNDHYRRRLFSSTVQIRNRSQ